MDFRFSPEVARLRAEVRDFLSEAMAGAHDHADPTDLTGLDAGFERELARQAGARGWLTLGGEARAAFELEVGRADAPLIDTAMTLAGFLVERFGSPRHRSDLLPRMAAGEVTLCIAYTEPSAGSDLAAIEALAARDGEGWSLTGHKVLVTGAHKADWCCTVARTTAGVPARDGTTLFLFELDRPGVEIVRQPTMNGWTLGEIRLDGVVLGSDDVLGQVDRGWSHLGAALAAERTGMFWIGFATHVFDLVVDAVRAVRPDDGVALDELGRLAAALADADRLARRAVWNRAQGDRPDPALGAMAKVAATELLQDLARTATELAGLDALVWSPLFGGTSPQGRLAWEYLERVHGTISVGANELQRDTIAQAGLGLPRSD